MPDITEILTALMSAPQQFGGLLGNALGIPKEEIKNAKGEVVFPVNDLERALQGSDHAAQSYAAAFMGPGARGAYRGAPDALMGFGAKQLDPYSMAPPPNFKYELPVRVKMKTPDLPKEWVDIAVKDYGMDNSGVFYTTVSGLNRSHALERAYREWPSAQYILPAHEINNFPGVP